MKIRCLVISILILSAASAQPKIEADLLIPYQYAVKGIYWALENIPVKKANLENDLITDNKLYANVRLSKEINGVKVKSTGYYNSYEVTITVYRTYESLELEGFIRKDIQEESNVEKEEK